MSERVIAGNTYKIGKLPAMKQFRVFKRLMPILGTVIGEIAPKDGAAPSVDLMKKIATPLMNGISAMPDEECDFIIGTCMAVVERQQSSMWSPVWNASAGMAMFNDIDLGIMLQLVWAVLQENLGSFLPAPGSDLIGAAAG